MHLLIDVISQILATSVLISNLYYIPTNNYLAAMEAQQSINLKIIEEFAVNNIEFAFPTQTLNIESNKAK